ARVSRGLNARYVGFMMIGMMRVPTATPGGPHGNDWAQFGSALASAKKEWPVILVGTLQSKVGQVIREVVPTFDPSGPGQEARDLRQRRVVLRAVRRPAVGRDRIQ